MAEKIYLDFKIGYGVNADVSPQAWFKARVPGAAQLDIAAAERLPDYKIGDNYKLYERFENYYYTYRAAVPAQKLKEGERCWFISGGIDYEFDILLNGKKAFYQEGMFTPVKLDVTEFAAKGFLLEIIIYKPPKRAGASKGRSEADDCVKPPVSYGWDWHPRLIPLGIWQETYLYISRGYIACAYPEYTLNGDLDKACITHCIEEEGGMRAAFSMRAPDGGIVFEGDAVPFTLDAVRLWWCNGYGEPALYDYEYVFSDGKGIVERIKGKLGIRKIEMGFNEGTWNGHLLPISRNMPPATVVLNNVPVFAKGSNWVNPEIYPGTISAETYRPIIGKARECNFNLLRCWGGSGINKREFYELCDLNGIMVWQEFPLACNRYEGGERYLRVLEQEAVSIIKALKKYACLALWCGGNELFNSWSMMSEQSPPLRLLNALCWRHDPARPFIPTSPLMGMKHGGYTFTYNGKDVFEISNITTGTAYNEFGVAGISNLNTILSFAAEKDVFPMRSNEVTLAHHGYEAWTPGETWCDVSTVEKYFGKNETLIGLIEKSQLMQSQGYKAVFEEARRQKPYCAMALNWCFNEPWPSVAGNSLINYPCEPKPCLYAVAESCKPITPSMRIKKFRWKANEPFAGELFILNDGLKKTPAGTLDVVFKLGGKKIFRRGFKIKGGGENKNISVGTAVFTLPDGNAELLEISLSFAGFTNGYTLKYDKEGL